MRQNLQKLYTRLLAMCMAALLLLGQMPAVFAAETSGKCGANLEWSFADHRLTITGSGDMTDYNQISLPPWYEFRDQIYYLSLPEGLTSVGNMAFYDCYNLTAISVPASVTDIGKMAFCQCRNVTILNLREGLLSIGRSAFEQCDGLQDLRLPNTVTTLGYHAFYNCTGLRYVTIPASVKEMDSGVFAYCKNLVRAEVDASLEVIPSWSFYGCDKLTSITLTEQTTSSEENAFTGCESLGTVYYPGSEENAEQLRENIAFDEESFGHFGVITDAVADADISSTDTTVGESGEVTVTDTTVNKTESATVTTTTSTTTGETGKTTSTEVTATVVTEDGWQALIDAILAAQKAQEKQESEGVETGKLEVDVFVTENSGVPTDVLNTVAGNNKLDMTVQTEDGSKFAVNGSTLESSQETGKVHFSYSATRMQAPDFPELSGTAAYKLQFSSSSAMKVEVLIRIPTEHARKTATLYQVNRGKLVLLQSVVVDTMGYAHFYLANVDAESEYRIGIEIPNIDKNTVIVPEELHSEYGVTDMVFASDLYVITGRQSSWGVNMTQVTIILMAVMVVSAVAVGVFMYIRNKKKLAAGYVPDISEEDLEE